ncbi:hypothetical protein [Gimesia chilikensis]|uniref:hypothetical protein n=1 Tax=Gimesia chilikensis TaxID=2605989 RepID=UPI00118B1DE7|nr:hypothetical protein [Gimesia chilikensis]QDT84588.1 hypothetical protein MalM14_22480 [Gimesia chilikensis]
MARKQVKNQKQNKPQTKTEETTPAPSAADFLNQNSGESFEQNSEGETETNQPVGTEETDPPAEPPAETPEPPAEAPKTPAENPDPEPPKQTPKPKQGDQKPAKNVRETMRKPRRGDPCSVQGCPGNLISYSRKRVEKKLILYLECSACKTKPTPDKQVINYGH